MTIKKYTLFSMLFHISFLVFLLLVPCHKRKMPFNSSYKVALAHPPPKLIKKKKDAAKAIEEKKKEPLQKAAPKAVKEPTKKRAKQIEKVVPEEDKKEEVVSRERSMPDIETPESDYTPIAEAPIETPENNMVVSKDISNFNHPDYLNRVRNIINHNWSTAMWNIGRDQQLHTQVSFRIGKSGVIARIRIEKSSGLPMYDTASLKAVQSSSPLPPLPEDYSGGYIDIFFDFGYERK